MIKVNIALWRAYDKFHVTFRELTVLVFVQTGVFTIFHLSVLNLRLYVFRPVQAGSLTTRVTGVMVYWPVCKRPRGFFQLSPLILGLNKMSIKYARCFKMLLSLLTSQYCMKQRTKWHTRSQFSLRKFQIFSHIVACRDAFQSGHNHTRNFLVSHFQQLLSPCVLIFQLYPDVQRLHKLHFLCTPVIEIHSPRRLWNRAPPYHPETWKISFTAPRKKFLPEGGVGGVLRFIEKLQTFFQFRNNEFFEHKNCTCVAVVEKSVWAKRRLDIWWNTWSERCVGNVRLSAKCSESFLFLFNFVMFN